MFELSIRAPFIAGYVRVGGDAGMSDDRWINDIFWKREKAKERTEQERAYALEQRRQFEAGCDAFFGALMNDLRSAVTVFNAKLQQQDQNATPIEVKDTGSREIIFSYGTTVLSVKLDEKLEKVVSLTTPGLGGVTLAIWRGGDAWELRREKNGTSDTVRNVPKELLLPMFEAAARHI